MPASRPAAPDIAIDASTVARGLGLPVDDFRRLMDARHITMLCERGVGEDAGRYRATYHYGQRRLQLVVDTDGHILATA
jgi:hypothetical protein